MISFAYRRRLEHERSSAAAAARGEKVVGRQEKKRVANELRPTHGPLATPSAAASWISSSYLGSPVCPPPPLNTTLMRLRRTGRARVAGQFREQLASSVATGWVAADVAWPVTAQGPSVAMWPSPRTLRWSATPEIPHFFSRSSPTQEIFISPASSRAISPQPAAGAPINTSRPALLPPPSPLLAMRQKQHVSIHYDVKYPIHTIPAEDGRAFAVDAAQQPLMDAARHIDTRRYATGVDERNFFTVYEYQINGHPIIWDYHTGYVHLTGLWKAIGNNKADIVKLMDNAPELEPVIKRVRGGYLKIQGTWLPYDVAKTLAARICYHIRFALIPLFGTDFVDSCLKPDQPGFGQLQLTLTEPKRRRRRSTNGATAAGGAAPPDRAGYLARQLAAQHHGDSFYMRSAKPAAPGDYRPPHYLMPKAHAHAHSHAPSHARSNSAGALSFVQALSSAPQYRPAAVQPYASPDHSTRYASPVSMGSPSPQSPLSSPRSMLRATLRTSKMRVSYDAVESSSDDDFADDDRAGDRSVKRRRTQSEPMKLSQAPPLPSRLTALEREEAARLANSPKDLLDMLRATRDLQQLSAMSFGRKLSFDRSSLGGGFECGGKLWSWDGQTSLKQVGVAESSAEPRGPRGPIDLRELALPRIQPRPALPPTTARPAPLPPRDKVGSMDIKSLIV